MDENKKDDAKDKSTDSGQKEPKPRRSFKVAVAEKEMEKYDKFLEQQGLSRKLKDPITKPKVNPRFDYSKYSEAEVTQLEICERQLEKYALKQKERKAKEQQEKEQREKEQLEKSRPSTSSASTTSTLKQQEKPSTSSASTTSTLKQQEKPSTSYASTSTLKHQEKPSTSSASTSTLKQERPSTSYASTSTLKHQEKPSTSSASTSSSLKTANLERSHQRIKAKKPADRVKPSRERLSKKKDKNGKDRKVSCTKTSSQASDVVGDQDKDIPEPLRTQTYPQTTDGKDEEKENPTTRISGIQSITYCIDDYSQQLKPPVDDTTNWVLEFPEEKIDSPANLISPIDAHGLEEDTEELLDEDSINIYKTPRSRARIQSKNVSSENVDTATTPTKGKSVPIPLLDWADNEEVWQNLVYKEEATAHLRSSKMFDGGRSSYLPRMRAILVNWIMEVCDCYHLRRNTYYLTVDYIDRFLTYKPTVPKTQLQLLGISCLFIAAKLEEIYPPKLSEFSYVCDGACNESEILECEVLILNILAWDINPSTPSGWLNLYMQIYAVKDDPDKNNKELKVNNCNFVYPQYSGYEFVRGSNVMDLFSMDPGYLRFRYSLIAAGAIYFIYGKTVVMEVTGLKWKDLKPVVNYMSVFYHLIGDTVDPRLASVLPDMDDARLQQTVRFIRKFVPKIIPDENHSIQTHLINLEYFENSMLLRVKGLGLNIEKGFIKKIKDDLGRVQYVKTTDNPEDADDKSTSVVMYDLTPNSDYTPIDNDLPVPVHPTDPDYEPGKINLLKIGETTTVTFDDILSSIHNEYDILKTYVAKSPLPSDLRYK